MGTFGRDVGAHEVKVGDQLYLPDVGQRAWYPVTEVCTLDTPDGDLVRVIYHAAGTECPRDSANAVYRVR